MVQSLFYSMLQVHWSECQTHFLVHKNGLKIVLKNSSKIVRGSSDPVLILLYASSSLEWMSNSSPWKAENSVIIQTPNKLSSFEGYPFNYSYSSVILPYASISLAWMSNSFSWKATPIIGHRANSVDLKVIRSTWQDHLSLGFWPHS